jgi:ribosome-binding ATPase YchF (GTP1/OBG family)
MMIGIIGAPNKGKSTLFSALTMHDVPIANRPFTTINPNLGVTYVSVECAEKKLKVRCNPKNSTCVDGVRQIPINVVDVAGLVEGAHEGKGMGNKFLNDLATADAFILVVDGSGETDPEGNPCGGCDPAKDVAIVSRELEEWISGIMEKHDAQISKRADGVDALYEVLSGLKISRDQIEIALGKANLPKSFFSPRHEDRIAFAKLLLEESKPMVVAFNKSDTKEAQENFKRFNVGKETVPCSAAIELAMRKAEKSGLISLDRESGAITVKKGVNEEQAEAIEYMKGFISNFHSTNIQELVNKTVFEVLDSIVVYPVEDEHKYTDHFGNVLPDAVLLKRGSTALDLAGHIHTDLAKNMLYAIDALNKKKVGKDYVLKNGDVIRIVSSARPG